jgi:hypothetical protein
VVQEGQGDARVAGDVAQTRASEAVVREVRIRGEEDCTLALHGIPFVVLRPRGSRLAGALVCARRAGMRMTCRGTSSCACVDDRAFINARDEGLLYGICRIPALAHHPTLPFIVLTGLDARSSTMTPKRPVSRRALALTSATLASLVALGALAPFGRALAADTIKVGVLHSLSGTMAISETVLKDTR